jgi:hypothetical protein
MAREIQATVRLDEAAIRRVIGEAVAHLKVDVAAVEREALLRAADDLDASDDFDDCGAPRWLRERAKAIGGDA